MGPGYLLQVTYPFRRDNELNMPLLEFHHHAAVPASSDNQIAVSVGSQSFNKVCADNLQFCTLPLLGHGDAVDAVNARWQGTYYWWLTIANSSGSGF